MSNINYIAILQEVIAARGAEPNLSARLATLGGPLVETDPVFTYSGGRVSRIDYASTNYKTFTYDLEGRLTQLDYVVGATTTRKTFNYNLDGTLASVEQETL